jgi:hypothetical protein
MQLSLILKNKRKLFLVMGLCIVGIFVLPSKIKITDDLHIDINTTPGTEMASAVTNSSSADSAALETTFSPRKLDVAAYEMLVEADLEAAPAVSNHKIITAAELFDDGRLNLSNMDRSMLDKEGRLFVNELTHLREFNSGDKLEIQMPYITALAVIKDNKVDENGNNTIVLDFQGKDRGYMILYKSVNAETFHGEIFINGKQYTYRAYKDFGVIVDMKKFVTWPMD